MTTQPEAMRLASMYDYGDPLAHGNKWKTAVCTELRRQHARIAGLEAQLAAVQQGVRPDVRACIRAELKNWHIESGDVSHYEDLADSLVSVIKSATHPTQQGLDAQNPQNAVLDLSARPTVQIHWARDGDPNVLLHSVSVDMDGSCTTAGVLEAVAAAINDYAKQARKKYGGGIPWDTMNFTNVRMHSRDADGDGASIDGHSVIVVPNKPPHGITISHPAALAAQAKQGGV